MAEEYRIDISVGATDNTGPALQSASKKVSQFEKSVEKTEQQLAKMQRTRWQLTVHAIDRASSVILAIDRRALSLTRRAWTITLRATDYATRPIRAVANLLTSTLGLLGVAGGTWAGVVTPLRMAGEFEQTQMAFETMLGDAQKARDFLAEAQQFAIKTPFGMEEVVQSSRLLMAFGFQTERILPMLEAIGDAAAGLGAGSEGIDRMTRALGQMWAKGRAQAEELMQLQEVGVPVAQILQEELGLTAEQVGNIGNQSIEVARVIDAILVGMQKRYGGMMQRQSESFLGMLSTIKDTFDTNVLRRWGEGLRLGIQPHLQRLMEWIDANQETIKRWGDTIQMAGQRAAEWLMDKLGGAYQWLQDVMASPEWQAAETPWEHLQVLWDKWWSGGGESWVQETGSKIGTALRTGIQAGFGTAWDLFKSVQGTAGGTLLDLWLLAQLAPGIWITGTGIAKSIQWGRKGWQWVRGLKIFGKGAAAAGGAAQAAAAAAQTAAATGAGAAATGAATAAAGASGAAAATTSALTSGAAAGAARVVPIYGPNGQILASVAQSADDVARAAATGSRLLSGLRGAVSTLGRYAGPIGAIVGTGIGLIGIGSAPDKGAAIGSAVGSGLGGWGGAAAGAALGSAVLPGIGTVIGGLLGGLLGGWGGGKLGGWLGDKVTPEPVAPVGTAGPINVQINITAQPEYKIDAAVDADEVLRIIERNQRRLADLLGDEIVEQLAAVFGNMTVTRRLQPVYATARYAEF